MDERRELLDKIEDAEKHLAVLSLGDTSSSLLSQNLTVAQFHLLMLLWAEGPVPAHSIATALGIGANSVTGMVDRLIARSLVERSEHPDDRRVRLVGLSGPGRALIDELTERARSQRRRLLNRLPEDHLRQFQQVLTSMLTAAAEMAAEEHAADGSPPSPPPEAQPR